MESNGPVTTGCIQLISVFHNIVLAPGPFNSHGIWSCQKVVNHLLACHGKLLNYRRACGFEGSPSNKPPFSAEMSGQRVCGNNMQ